MDTRVGYRVERRNPQEDHENNPDNPWVAIVFIEDDLSLARSIFGRETRMPDLAKFELRLIHYSEATQWMASWVNDAN